MKQLKNRKTLTLVLCLVLVSVFTLTIAYSALTAVLTINGNARVSAADWDIYLNNPRVTNGSATTNLPVIKTSSTLEFETTLNMPGDFYEFVVDVVNGGDIDAMIENVVKTPDLTEEQAKFLKYEVSYQNGEAITTKQLLAKDTTMPIKVRIEYRKDLVASDLPTGQVVLDLSLTLEYIQSDGTGANVKDNGALKLATANGSLDAIGTIVTIGDQQFYTIGTEGDNVKLLSMYNLYVGGTYSGDISFAPYESEATGMQDSRMIGEFHGYSDDNPIKGVTPFANKDFHGENYADYSGSLAEYYVNNYKNILQRYVTVDEARLIYREELEDTNTFNCVKYGSCSDNYPWIYSTSYWTGTAMGNEALWFVNTRNMFVNSTYDNNRCYGIRPVIVISKDYFN